MILTPDQYDSSSALDLLIAAEAGLIGFDRQVLRSLTSRPEETIDALDKFTSGHREDAVLDLTEQVFDLYRHFRTPRAIPYFLKLAALGQDRAPEDLAEALAELGRPAIDPLLNLYEALGEEDGSDILFFLAALRQRDARIVPHLEATLARDPYEGGICIGLYGDPALKPVVQKALDALPADQEQERKALQDCLAELGAPIAEDESTAFDLTAPYPERALPMLDLLAEPAVRGFLAAPEAEYRAAAADSFADTDFDDDSRDALLAAARSDESPAVRGASLRALAVRLKEKAVRELLRAAIENADASPEERAGAAIALAPSGVGGAVGKAIRVLYEKPETRAAALEAMYRSMDPVFAPEFVENLRHEDVEVAREAIRGIGLLALDDVAIELVPLMQDDDLREDALYAYAMSTPSALTPDTVHQVFEEISGKAGGLSGDESNIVGMALDQRLERSGFEPVFFPEADGEDEEDAEGDDAHHHHGNGQVH